jgi:hypothetical protein
MMSNTELLRKVYYDIKNPASFSSAEKLYQEARKYDTNITRQDVIDFLSGEIAYTLHRRAVRRYPRNPIIVSRPNEMAQSDLIDMQKYAPDNNGFRYILTLIDVFSKKAFAIPIKGKTGRAVSEALKEIFTQYVPKNLQTDEGSEYKNKEVQSLLKKYNIHYFVARNEHIKCSIVERFHRTLLSKIHKYFTATGTRRYCDKLDSFMKAYNNSVHRSIKMTPNDVNDNNRRKVFRNLYGTNTLRELLKRQYRQKVMKEGDNVRIQAPKGTFTKGYLQNFTDRIYKIDRPMRGVRRPVYRLKEYDGKVIKGNFYPEEVQKVREGDLFRVRILGERKRGGEKQNLIEWVEYPDYEPEWIPASRLEDLS